MVLLLLEEVVLGLQQFAVCGIPCGVPGGVHGDGRCVVFEMKSSSAAGGMS